MKSVCVVILNYGTPSMTIECAESALAAIDAINGEIIVVDNASPDDSFEQFTAWRQSKPDDTPIKLVQSPVNGGYAAGNNLGVQAGNAEFFVLANSDTLIRPDALKILLGEMRADPELGIVGPKITDENGAPAISRFRLITPISEFVHATELGVFFKLLRNHVVPVQDTEDDSAVQWIGFPCVMLRKRMIDEIGLLDEDYFMYFEDMAYCRRATDAGWRLRRCDRAEVQHFCGKSSNIEDSAAAHARLPAYYYASRTRYFTSFFGQGGFIAANIGWYMGRAINYLRLLVFQKPKKTCAARARDIWTAAGAGRPAHLKGGVS